MNRLHVDSIDKSFDERQLLSDIYLSCAPGDIVGLLGRNGSGKSTLLQIIFGSVDANHKYVNADGVLFRSFHQCKGKICYLPQENFLPSHIRLSTSIELLCDEKEIDALKHSPFIEPFLDKKPGSFSGGELRLIEFLLLIHSPAPYLLIDEPFKGIAPVNRAAIITLLQEKAKSKGFIITDHDYTNILAVSTRVVLLCDGGTIEIKDRNELVRHGYLNG